MNYSGKESQWQYITRHGMAFNVLSGVITMGVASSNNYILYIVNNSQNTIIRFKELILTTTRQGGSAPQTSFSLYRNPTVTSSGTPLTITRINLSSDVASEMQAFKNPTVSSPGTLIQYLQSGEGTLARDLELSRYVPIGGSLLINAVSDTASILTNATFTWAEEYL